MKIDNKNNIINGNEIAKITREYITNEAIKMKEKYNIMPGLAVVIVGDDPASHTYVNRMEKTCIKCEILSKVYRLPASTSQDELLDLINQLNNDPHIHGILIQLPLPKGIDENIITSSICPKKDVDGVHPQNIGNLLIGKDAIVPCTPKGIMQLIKSTGEEISGKHAVVVGRSNIVGKPAAILLLAENATVTICHSRTKDLEEYTKKADILVAAVGSPELIKGDMIKEGAIVIDAGTTVVEDKLVGDVEYMIASQKASYITPVPGGVGPMTIAMLLQNTLEAALKKCK